MNSNEKRRSKLLRPLGLGFAGTALLILIPPIALVGCKPSSEEGQQRSRSSNNDSSPFSPREQRAFLTPVVAERLVRDDVLSTIASTGSVVPIRSRLIRSEESGRLRFSRQWEEGDPVSAGDLIATIESETLEADIDNARRDVQIRQESLDIARRSRDSSIRDFNTTRDLYTRGIVAQRDLENAQLQMERGINTYRQEQINLDRAKAALANREERLERLEIRAPFDGLLVARTTLDGTRPFAATFGSETITDFDGRLISSEFAVCGIIDMSRALIRSDITGSNIASVSIGQEARAVIYARGDLPIEGTVVDISRSVNPDTRAFNVDILVENPEDNLRPGMFGRVDIVTDRRRDAISIPRRLLLRRNNRDVVFVVEEDVELPHPVAREVPVELGLQGRDTIEVTWGLQEGDAIIVRGFEVLQDRTPIQVIYADEPITPEGARAIESIEGNGEDQE
ncbi:MAG: efflux RND transporter periplasmic adaptor subunit [Candidatus Sumerlaeia bacterium]|nr:efflux RND transporter periplasmic adaptor subunit [Candidatus Sumerlaeia bacterium]